MAEQVATLNVGIDEKSLEASIRRAITNAERQPVNVQINSNNGLKTLTKDADDFTSAIRESANGIVAFGRSVSVFFVLDQALSSLVSSAIEVEKTFAEINIIFQATGERLDSLQKGVFDIAKNTGQSFGEVAKATQEFARQGLTLEETLKRTNDALVLTRLSGIGVGNAVEAITAGINSFNRESLTSAEIVNKLVAVDQNFAVSSADLAESISRAGAVAQDAGVSFDKFLAIVTAASTITARGGAVISNAFKTIFTRLEKPEVLEQLEKLGVTVEGLPGQFLPADQILQSLANRFNSLDDSQQAFATRLVGGVFQANQLKAVLGDLSSKFSIVNNAYQTSKNATDAANKSNQELNNTLDALTNKTLTNLKEVASTVGGLSFGPAIRNLFGGFNGLVDETQASDSGKKFGEFFLKGLGGVISGPGLVAAGALITKLIASLTRFTIDQTANALNLTAQSQKQNNELSKGNSLASEAVSLGNQRVAVATKIAEREAVTTAELQRQATLRKQSAIPTISPEFENLGPERGVSRPIAGLLGNGSTLGSASDRRIEPFNQRGAPGELREGFETPTDRLNRLKAAGGATDFAAPKSFNLSNLAGPAFLASLAIPFIGQAINSSGITQSTESQKRVSEGANGLATGLSIASLAPLAGPFAEIVVAAGVLVGAFKVLSAATDDFDTSIDDARKKQKEDNEKSNQLNDSISGLIKAKANVQNVIDTGGTPEEVSRANQKALEAFSNIKSPDVQKQLAGKSLEDIIAFQGKSGAEIDISKAKTDFQIQLQELAKDISKQTSVFGNTETENRNGRTAFTGVFDNGAGKDRLNDLIRTALRSGVTSDNIESTRGTFQGNQFAFDKFREAFAAAEELANAEKAAAEATRKLTESFVGLKDQSQIQLNQSLAQSGLREQARVGSLQVQRAGLDQSSNLITPFLSEIGKTNLSSLKANADIQSKTSAEVGKAVEEALSKASSITGQTKDVAQQVALSKEIAESIRKNQSVSSNPLNDVFSKLTNSLGKTDQGVKDELEKVGLNLQNQLEGIRINSQVAVEENKKQTEGTIQLIELNRQLNAFGGTKGFLEGSKTDTSTIQAGDQARLRINDLLTNPETQRAIRAQFPVGTQGNIQSQGEFQRQLTEATRDLAKSLETQKAAGLKIELSDKDRDAISQGRAGNVTEQVKSIVGSSSLSNLSSLGGQRALDAESLKRLATEGATNGSLDSILNKVALEIDSLQHNVAQNGGARPEVLKAIQELQSFGSLLGKSNELLKNSQDAGIKGTAVEFPSDTINKTPGGKTVEDSFQAYIKNIQSVNDIQTANVVALVDNTKTLAEFNKKFDNGEDVRNGTLQKTKEEEQKAKNEQATGELKATGTITINVNGVTQQLDGSTVIEQLSRGEVIDIVNQVVQGQAPPPKVTLPAPRDFHFSQ